MNMVEKEKIKATGFPKSVYISLAVIFISVFTLLYIFDSISKIADKCKTENLEICKLLSGFNLTMLFILLLISGFLISIWGAVYIIFSA
jgi:hypothetical protein